jgi:membrane associated rhomboid family serine protease
MTARREPIFNVPAVVLVMVLVLVGIHAVREFLPTEIDNDLLVEFSFVPGRFTAAFDPDRISAAIDALAATDETRAEIARFLLGDRQPLWWTTVTYALLHANWTHVGFNCLWLVAFGAAVARRFGLVRFLIFAVFAAIAGAAAHYITHIDDVQIVIGASAVVSAAMAAAARFVFQPGAPLNANSIFADPREGDHAYRKPALSLVGILSDQRALTFLVIWFLVNLLFGLTPVLSGFAGGAVAWEAHVGGFFFGLLAFPLFDPPAPAIPQDQPKP